MFWDQVFHIITRQLISRVYPISATKGRTGQFCGSNPMNQPSHNRNLSGAFVLLVNIVGVRVLFELLLYRLVYLCVCTLSNQNRTFILIFHPICVLLCPRLLMGIVLRRLSKYMHVFTPLIQWWDDLLWLQCTMVFWYCLPFRNNRVDLRFLASSVLATIVCFPLFC